MAAQRNIPLRPAVRERVTHALEAERVVRVGLMNVGYDAFSEAVRMADARIEALEWALGEKETG